MSGDSEELTLNRKESEEAVSENNVDKAGKKFKRNYCYLCSVQCTSEKNFLAHKNGRKHLNKTSDLRLAEEKKKPAASSSKKKKNFQKNVHRSSKTLKSSKRKLDNSKAPDSQNSLTSTDNITQKTMNHSNRQTPRSKRCQYINPNYDDRYSRFQNSRNPYSGNYKNQETYYNSSSYCEYPQWDTVHPANIDSVHSCSYIEPANQHYSSNRYDASYNNDFFSGNKYAFFNSRGNLSRNTYSPVHPEHSDRPYYRPFKIEAEARNSKSNSPGFEYSEKSTAKVYPGGKDSLENTDASHTFKTIISNAEPSPTVKASISNSNPSDTSNLNADKNDTDTSQTTSLHENNTEKLDKTNRIRSRSLSSSENSSSGKRTKDKTESQSVDSDNASEEQRIKEWTDSLLDTSHNKISRLLHPSNYKEKAAVNHLLTKFSKSKRKENLTRNIRSNSLGSTDMNDDETDGANKSEESLNIESDEICIILDSNETSSILEPNDSCTIKKENDSFLSKKKTKKVSEKIITDDDSKNQKLSGTSNVKSPVPVPTEQCCISPSKRGRRRSKGYNTYSRKPTENRKEKTLCVDSERTKKRKSYSNDTSGKRQKFYSPPDFSEQPISRKITELKDLYKDASVVENSPGSDSIKTVNPAATDALPSLKDEVPDDCDVNPSVSSTTEDSQNILNPSEINSDISVETLIQLFASGSVKVKEEFNDPVMDAIKGISPDELIYACSNQSFFNKENETTKTHTDSNLESSRDKSVHVTPDETNNSVNPVSMESSNVNVTPISVNNDVEKISNNSLPGMKDPINSSPEMQNLLHKTQPELPSHVNKLIKQLQEISSQEETVKTSLVEAKLKISEINFLLEEWKRKKKKLQDEEEELRKQRNAIIKSLQNAVEANDDNVPKSSVLEENATSESSSKNVQNSNDDNIEVENTLMKSCTFSTPINSMEKEQKKNKTLIPSEFEEIIFLPPPVRPKPPEITIFDDTDEHASKGDGNKIVTSVLSSNESSFFEIKDITAHGTVINCLVVFEDFLYTCSNDNTGKRFSLKDSSLNVTYYHSAKNVTEIAVEKVQNEALVLTSCSTRVISLFIASSGTKIKTFFPPCTVMSICKGWGKFYSGLANGAVNVYNWKYEEREVVKTESPANRIATAHQGRLHVLVILSSDGNIAIRDAETGLLIRFIKIYVKHPSWMTVYNDLAYVSSSDKSLIILDIMSGKVEKRLYLSSTTTGLAVYEDYIFTISYSGVINCFNKDKCPANKMLYYGAGRNGLTCVHVYQDWIFTGNRKGHVSLFRFDPCSTVACEFGKCDFIYGLKEDLEYHVENDHLSKKKNLPKCSWQGCDYIFPMICDINNKMDHLRKHFY